MKYIKVISATVLCMSLAACGAKAEEPAVKTDEEETAAETALNSPEHDDEAQPEQSKEPNAEFELPEGTISLYIPEEGWSASLTDDKVVITSQDYEETWMYVYFDDFFGDIVKGYRESILKDEKLEANSNDKKDNAKKSTSPSTTEDWA